MSKLQDEGIDLTNFNKEIEIAKFKHIKPQGWTVIVRLYTEPTMVNGIIRTSSTHDEQQYHNCVGLVVSKSFAAYQDNNRYGQTGSWCEVGDWVLFPRHAGYKILSDGIPLFVLKEDAIDAIIEDPSKIVR